MVTSDFDQALLAAEAFCDETPFWLPAPDAPYAELRPFFVASDRRLEWSGLRYLLSEVAPSLLEGFWLES